MFAALILTFLLFPSHANAQSANPTATLSGTVLDPAGAAIATATVVARNSETGLTRTVTTDAQGAYRIISLSPGEYEIKVEAKGFSQSKPAGITVQIGQSVRLDFTLALAGASGEVNVSAEAPAVDVAQTTPSVSVDLERIEELPVQQRRFLNFVLTAPGVVSSATQARGGGSAGGIGTRRIPDSGFSFGGLRARSNNIAIDGVDNNDETTGAGRSELSIEAIREFQVTSNGMSAEFGGASGGSVNAITRTGTNDFHGGVFIYTAHDALNARQPVFASEEAAARKPKLHRWQPGFDVGGPIRKGRTFFHATLEQEHESGEDASDIAPAVANQINAALAAGALPQLGARKLGAGLFHSSGDDTEGAFKLNQQLGAASSLMLRYAFTNDRRWRDALGTGGLSEFSSRGDSFTRDNVLVGQWLGVLGQSAVNDLRFQVARRHVLLRPNEPRGPQVLVSGHLTFGRATDAPSERTEDHYQILDSVALSRGRHQIRSGGAVNHVRLDASLADRLGGFAIFSSVADLLNAKPELLAQSFGNPRTQINVTGIGGFAQDHWQVHPGVTLDLGLRYDYEALPAQFHRDPNNFSPRVGVAWNPDAAHRWVLRGAYGIYFDRYLLAFLNQAVQKDGRRGYEQVFNGAAAVGVFNGGPRPAVFMPSIYRADPRLATPYSQQATTGIEHQLFSDITLSVNYLFVRGTKLARTRNVNLTPPVILTSANAATLGINNPAPQQPGRPVFGPDRLDSRYDAIWQLEDAASSIYHGMTASLGRRLTRRFGLQTSYTLSKTIDDASDFDEQPQNPYDLRAERALSRQDQRQRFVLSGVFNIFGDADDQVPGAGRKGLLGTLLEGIELAPILTLASGRRFNPLVGTDANRSLALPLAARPLGFARNSLGGPAQKNLDLRVLERIRARAGHALLDIAADFFNLTNTTGVRELSPFFGAGLTPLPRFGKAIDAFGARRVQFSIEFEF
ncbi:MAG TPA: TonB-dependent receptor [Blastocatellia bacterium]|nr:TonB-dependent receptor [Blastocatellia bacterium]